MREMEDRMRAMEQMYSRRLMSEVSLVVLFKRESPFDNGQLEQNELKTDAKIDMLHQSGLFGMPSKKPARYDVGDEISEEEDIASSLV